MWVFLPCIWPPDVRTWLPDQSTRREVVIAFDVGGQVIAAERRLLSEEELQVQEWDAAADLEVGIQLF